MDDTSGQPTRWPSSPSEPQHSIRTEDANLPEQPVLESPFSIENPEFASCPFGDPSSSNNAISGYARHDSAQNNRDILSSEDVNTSHLISESTASDASESTDHDDGDELLNDIRQRVPIINGDLITASPQTIVQQIVHDTYLSLKNIEINVETTISVHRDASPQPDEPLNIVTYADATNIAASYPELAATVLSMPLSARSISLHTARDHPQSPSSTAQEPIPIHTADRPNWAFAPDTAESPAHTGTTKKTGSQGARKGGRSPKDSLSPPTSFLPHQPRDRRNHEDIFPRQREPRFSQELQSHSVKNSSDAWDVVPDPTSTGDDSSHAAIEPSSTKPNGTERINSGPEEDVDKWILPFDRDDDDCRIIFEGRTTVQSAPTLSLNATERIYLGQDVRAAVPREARALNEGLLLVNSRVHSAGSTTGQRLLATPRSISWNGALPDITRRGLDLGNYLNESDASLRSSSVARPPLASADPVAEYWQNVHDTWPVPEASHCPQPLQQDNDLSLGSGLTSGSMASEPYGSEGRLEPGSSEGRRMQQQALQSDWITPGGASVIPDVLRDIPPPISGQFPRNDWIKPETSPKTLIQSSGRRSLDSRPNIGSTACQVDIDCPRQSSETAWPQVSPPSNQQSPRDTGSNLWKQSFGVREPGPKAFLSSRSAEEEFHNNPPRPQVFRDAILTSGLISKAEDLGPESLEPGDAHKQLQKQRKSQVVGITATDERYLSLPRSGSDKSSSDDPQELGNTSGTSASWIIIEASRLSADNPTVSVSAPLQTHPEGLSWRAGQRNDSEERRTKLRARSSSPKPVPTYSGRGRNFSPTAITDGPRKYGLINSGTPPHAPYTTHDESTFHEIGRRVNTPPPSSRSHNYDALGLSKSSSSITSSNSSVGGTISPSPSRNGRSSGKENRLRAVELDEHALLYRV
ncbi:hypothetical protein D9758_004849 [Tetrapyrgos nigripes]|uniref:Uncharacterized protein n=1 Tax=Tetrapyrgos nigripes TaxID=182062 RepID=A0A8H5G5T1_9AGAR|nr:hypothetical protein D9758_004849 [Tetrapyrgos nigripes]